MIYHDKINVQTAHKAVVCRIMTIYEKIQNTHVGKSIEALDKIYRTIDEQQTEWKKHSPAQCPDGCGCCCVDFEPDVLECEALYLAAWLLENQPDVAEAVLTQTYKPYRKDSETHPKGCFLFNPDSPYHCTVYNGRNLICRLFGYSSDTGKDGLVRWRICKFNPNQPAVQTSCGKKEIERRQYNQAELQELCGALPPVMADVMSQAVAINPDNTTTTPLRKALPEALYKLKMILSYNS